MKNNIIVATGVVLVAVAFPVMPPMSMMMIGMKTLKISEGVVTACG